MGTQRVDPTGDPEALRRFTARLLDDLDRLESLLGAGGIESGPARIGAELELCLVDDRCQPSTLGPALLGEMDDPRVTPELGVYNLEINAKPYALGGTCLSDLETQLLNVLGTVGERAARHGVRPVLTGILPTLQSRHASLDYMTPADRYRRLNEAMTGARGGPYRVFIRGVDEINIVHDTVMLEAANTSFQLHLQVDPARFAHLYNLALLATAPLIAVGCNSPLLFGRRLWRETRIALFEQSIDTRRPGSEHRILMPRVHFGTSWVEDSVLEIFRDDVTRFRTLLAADLEPEDDHPPRLRALHLFNSTVYRWLRPCYGIGGEKPHLRIENRVLPAGPTPVDQVANAAFWYGLLYGLDARVGDPRDRIGFDDVRGNFVSAARFGLGAPLTWLDGRQEHARDLIAEELLEIATRGLERAGIEEGDARRYLGIIGERTRTRQTGSEWMLRALTNLREPGVEPWARLTEAMIERQAENRPVHEWSIPNAPTQTIGARLRRRVAAHMQRDLVTVRETDPVGLAIHLMKWRRIRHLPVEDDDQRLVGLVTRSTLFRFLADTRASGRDGSLVPLSEIMQSDLVTASPDTTVADAIRLMRARGVSSLPVVEGDRLVGLVTERDFLSLAADTLLGPQEGDEPGG